MQVTQRLIHNCIEVALKYFEQRNATQRNATERSLPAQSISITSLSDI